MTAMRTLRGLAVLALLAVAVGCGGPGEAGSQDKADDRTETKADPGEPGLHKKVKVDGGKTYDVYVPKGRKLDEPVPAVLVLHGMPGDAAEAREQSGLDALADDEGFLAVYPDNPNGSWTPNPDDEGDSDFVRDIITDLTGTWNADPERIFVSGTSNGGDMALTIGAKLPDLVAGIAAVVPAGTEEVAKVMDAVETPVPLIAFFGGNDPREGLGLDLVATWRDRVECGKAKTDKGKQVTVREYACADDTAVVTQEVHEGFHEWFGTAAEPEPVWASAAMWEFFTRQS